MWLLFIYDFCDNGKDVQYISKGSFIVFVFGSRASHKLDNMILHRRK